MAVMVRRVLPNRGRAADYHARNHRYHVDTTAPIVPDKERPSLIPGTRRSWQDLRFTIAPYPHWQLDRFLGTHVAYRRVHTLPKGRMAPRPERVNIHRPQPITYGEFVGEVG